MVLMINLSECLSFVLGRRIHHPGQNEAAPNILCNSLEEKCAWGLKYGLSSPMSLITCRAR